MLRLFGLKLVGEVAVAVVCTTRAASARAHFLLTFAVPPHMRQRMRRHRAAGRVGATLPSSDPITAGIASFYQHFALTHGVDKLVREEAATTGCVRELHGVCTRVGGEE